MNVEEFVENFKKTITDINSPSEKIEVIAGLLGAVFGVSGDEVAVFSLDKSRDVLVFIWPRSLKSIGSIPMNAHRCLVTKTAADRKGGLDNSFASTPHLYMFEHFLSNKESRIPIQKIMSVPVMSGDQLKGVVQIARKGSDRDSAGEDFTTADLSFLSAAAELIADYL